MVLPTWYMDAEHMEALERPPHPWVLPPTKEDGCRFWTSKTGCWCSYCGYKVRPALIERAVGEILQSQIGNLLYVPKLISEFAAEIKPKPELPGRYEEYRFGVLVENRPVIQPCCCCVHDYGYDSFDEVEKPVIYLYPEQDTQARVELTLRCGKFSFLYPTPDAKTESTHGGSVVWNVTASGSKGALRRCSLAHKNRRNVPYLFWEASGMFGDLWRMSHAPRYLVPGEDAVEFLEDVATAHGLNMVETTDFVTYWGPRMAAHQYSIAWFPHSIYEQQAVLSVEPRPDRMIRLYLVFKGFDAPPAAALDLPRRYPEAPTQPSRDSGFVAVEWGGSELH